MWMFCLIYDLCDFLPFSQLLKDFQGFFVPAFGKENPGGLWHENHGEKRQGWKIAMHKYLGFAEIPWEKYAF